MDQFSSFWAKRIWETNERKRNTYTWSYINYNTFIVRHNKRRKYFKNIYKTFMRLEQLERNRTKMKKNYTP